LENLDVEKGERSGWKKVGRAVEQDLGAPGAKERK
jgi:hypothetical protein